MRILLSLAALHATPCACAAAYRRRGPACRMSGGRWRERYGVDILDGPRPNRDAAHLSVEYPGATRLPRDHRPVPFPATTSSSPRRSPARPGGRRRDGELLEASRRPDRRQAMYWNNRAQSRHTFLGRMDPLGRQIHRVTLGDGYYVLLRPPRRHAEGLGPLRVSPFEVEAALPDPWPDVLECAVAGLARRPTGPLTKPKACCGVGSSATTWPCAELSRWRCRTMSKQKLAPSSNIRAGSSSASELAEDCHRENPTVQIVG